MKFNKIITKGGEAIIDLTKATISPEALAIGITALDKFGNLITGIAGDAKNSVFDVETLPTENIAPNCLYRISESKQQEASVYIYLPALGEEPITLGELFSLELPEATVIETITEVDVLPDPMPTFIMDEATLTVTMPIYILKSTGAAYINTGGAPMSIGEGLFNDPSYDKGYIESKEAIQSEGAYSIRGESYTVYHYWTYNENQWVELVTTLKVTTLPTENILFNTCYILVDTEGKKQYFMYDTTGEWIEYSAGGSEEFLNYISGIDSEIFECPENIESIAPYAFYNRAYKIVIIPNTIKTIGDNAFMNCANLTDIYFTGSEEEWNAITINEGNDILATVNKTYNYEKNS